jgi:hypothetical protein
VSDELKLIDAAKDGSVEAFTELVHGYRERLFRFLLTRCASHADAEDALQDTLINAYRYIGSYNPQWRFSTWPTRESSGRPTWPSLAISRTKVPIRLRTALRIPSATTCGASQSASCRTRCLRRCGCYVGAGYRERSRAIVFVDQG